jgi:hypothetical protein
MSNRWITIVVALGACAIIALIVMEQYHTAHVLFWVLGIGLGARYYVRGARRRDEERMLQSRDRLLDRESSGDPNRLERRAQAQADRFSNSRRNLPR